MTPPYTVDRDKWSKMTIFEQMGNIGSEVGRSIKAQKNGDQQLFEAAVARALDLFDATVEILLVHKSLRTKEVLRAKDQYLSSIYGTNQSSDRTDSIERYFTQYAVAARLTR